jgi:hypothetical protein
MGIKVAPRIGIKVAPRIGIKVAPRIGIKVAPRLMYLRCDLKALLQILSACLVHYPHFIHVLPILCDPQYF